MVFSTVVLHPALGFPAVTAPEPDEDRLHFDIAFLASRRLQETFGNEDSGPLLNRWTLVPWAARPQVRRADPIPPSAKNALAVKNVRVAQALRASRDNLDDGLVFRHDGPRKLHVKVLPDVLDLFRYIMGRDLRLHFATVYLPRLRPGLYCMVETLDAGGGLREYRILRRVLLEALPRHREEARAILRYARASRWFEAIFESQNLDHMVVGLHPVKVLEKSDAPALDKLAHLSDLHVDRRLRTYAKRAKDKSLPAFNNFNDRVHEFVADAHLRTRASAIVMTGDLVNYNMGHEERKDRGPKDKQVYYIHGNWREFYEILIKSYDFTGQVGGSSGPGMPIFTVLGNHDYYVFPHAVSPRLFGVDVFDTSADMNVKVENLVSIEGNPNAFTSIIDKLEVHQSIVAALWYFVVINPFADYSFQYQNSAFIALDWGGEDEMRTLDSLFEWLDKAQRNSAFSITAGRRRASLPNPMSQLLPPPWNWILGGPALWPTPSDVLPRAKRAFSALQIALVRAVLAKPLAFDRCILATHVPIYAPFPDTGDETFMRGFPANLMAPPDDEENPQPVYGVALHHRSPDGKGQDVVTLLNDAMRANQKLVAVALCGHNHRNSILQVQANSRIQSPRPSDSEGNVFEMGTLSPVYVVTTSGGPQGIANAKGDPKDRRHGLACKRLVAAGYRLVEIRQDPDTGDDYVRVENRWSTQQPVQDAVGTEFRELNVIRDALVEVGGRPMGIDYCEQKR